jgi:hypothetical protein
VSMLDLAGKGRFTISTGVGAEGWTTAANRVGEVLHVTIQAVENSKRVEVGRYISSLGECACCGG